jgi:hypothetical protein
VLSLAFACLLLLAAGRPLHYWGSRAPIVVAEVQRGAGPSAQLENVSAVMTEGSLVLRLTFDRALHDVLYLKDGSPVSGRLRATVYLDVDDDRHTGADLGPADLRTGTDFELDLGAMTLGADPEEKRPAQALVTIALVSRQDGRRKTVWRADDSSHPDAISLYGSWLDVRLPKGALSPKSGARVILVSSGRSFDGRYTP